MENSTVLQCDVDGELLAAGTAGAPLQFALAESAEMAKQVEPAFTLPEGKWLRVSVEVIDKPEQLGG